MIKTLQRTSSILAAIVVLFSISCQPKQKDQTKDQSPQKPNIIYILADDLGYGDLSCYGQEKFQTPNIDKLADMGIKFTRHYAGSTVCAPSRSALMTGQHTGHTPIRGNQGVEPEGQVPIDSAALTIAEVLKQEGYITGAFGKWGLGYPGSEGDPNFQGFDEFFGYNSQTLGHNYYPYHLWHNQEKVILAENAGRGSGIYAPSLIHEHVLDFIEANKDTSFFLFYPTIIPHAELVAPEAYMDKYRGKFLPEKSYKGVDDGPRYRLGPYGSQPESHAAFAAMMNVLDVHVGNILGKIEDLGLMENTLIIFTSDNGPHVEGGADPDYFNGNGPLKGYKRDLYEGGIRVPMLAVWANKIKPGVESKHISAFWDVMPTICEMLDIEVPINTDGISFLPELLGEPQEKHNHLYWEFLERGGRQAVVMNNWKGIRLNMDNNPHAPIELYNLDSDIGETNNIAASNPDIVKKIDSIMDAEHVSSDLFPFEFETKVD